jgi:uncharacterized membrane protein
MCAYLGVMHVGVLMLAIAIAMVWLACLFCWRVAKPLLGGDGNLSCALCFP